MPSRHVFADEERIALQRLVDALFAERAQVQRLDVIVRAEALDLPEDLRGLIELLPPGAYVRHTLCDQLNSALKGHGWMGRFATVD